MYNYKTVFYTLGTLQIILGVFMLIPVIIQLIFNELDSGFVSASIITIVFGVLFFLSNLDHDKNIDLPQAFILTALSWLSIAIFGSFLFFIIPYDKKYNVLLGWDWFKKIPWDILILFGGGLSMASLVVSTGLAKDLSENLNYIKNYALYIII